MRIRNILYVLICVGVSFLICEGCSTFTDKDNCMSGNVNFQAAAQKYQWVQLLRANLDIGEEIISVTKRHQWRHLRDLPRQFSREINADYFGDLSEFLIKGERVDLSGTVTDVVPIATIHIGNEYLLSNSARILALTTVRIDPAYIAIHRDIPEYLVFMQMYINDNMDKHDPHRLWDAFIIDWLPEIRVDICIDRVEGERIRVVGARYACPLHREEYCSCSIIRGEHYIRQVGESFIPEVTDVIRIIHETRAKEGTLSREMLVVDNRYIVVWVMRDEPLAESWMGSTEWNYIIEFWSVKSGELVWWTLPNDSWKRNVEYLKQTEDDIWFEIRAPKW